MRFMKYMLIVISLSLVCNFANGATVQDQRDAVASYENYSRQVANLDRIILRWNITIDETMQNLDDIVLYDLNAPISVTPLGIETFHVEIRIGNEIATMLASSLLPIFISTRDYLVIQRDAVVMP